MTNYSFFNNQINHYDSQHLAMFSGKGGVGKTTVAAAFGWALANRYPAHTIRMRLAWIFQLWMKYQNVLGRVDLMGRLRNLRQPVMQALAAVIAEQVRLTASLQKMGVSQRYVVHNRYRPDEEIDSQLFAEQTIVHLPSLPRSVPPFDRIKGRRISYFRLVSRENSGGIL